ncbi:hypothetical protein DFQ28_002954 [Apophysomyces sp. BC1034]|nr:hypothetical protein DFQ30_004130 [Apophysomyces sp. BC1015]KAG0183599.1 hypothetical protein DFQ29_000024 [Apophysomyces sp. BC1021]KAG0183621.1 hypothetical protein DFQ29_000046 [Apophysomyces sp. BC1021]KAG0194879.1 hypothetical protein DFQ28_002954 [Apophysomyces sp. BC1034]
MSSINNPHSYDNVAEVGETRTNAQINTSYVQPSPQITDENTAAIAPVSSFEQSPERMALETYRALQDQVAKLVAIYQDMIIRGASAEEKTGASEALQSARAEMKDYRQICKARYPHRREFFTWQELSAEQDAACNRSRLVENCSSSAERYVSNDLPVLQFVGEPKWHPSKVVHHSVESFLRTFEKELGAINLPAEQYWSHILPKCLNDAQKSWLDHELKYSPSISWPEMRRKILDKYDTPEQKMRAMEAVIRMRQKKNEPTESYVRHYQRRCIETGLDKEPVPMILILLSSLEKSNFALTSVATKFGDLFRGHSLDYMCQYIIDLQLDDKPEQPKRPRDADGYIIPDRHTRPHVRSKKSSGSGPSESRPSPSDTSASQKKSSSLCRYCFTPWFRGHKCEEFFSKNDRKPRNPKPLARHAPL